MTDQSAQPGRYGAALNWAAPIVSGTTATAATASATPAAMNTRRHAPAAPKTTVSTIDMSASRFFHMPLPPLSVVHGCGTEVEKIGPALTAVMERQRGALYRPHLPVCSDKPNRVVVLTSANRSPAQRVQSPGRGLTERKE
jgi:hypothetical protein